MLSMMSVSILFGASLREHIVDDLINAAETSSTCSRDLNDGRGASAPLLASPLNLVEGEDLKWHIAEFYKAMFGQEQVANIHLQDDLMKCSSIIAIAICVAITISRGARLLSYLA